MHTAVTGCIDCGHRLYPLCRRALNGLCTLWSQVVSTVVTGCITIGATYTNGSFGQNSAFAIQYHASRSHAGGHSSHLVGSSVALNSYALRLSPMLYLQKSRHAASGSAHSSFLTTQSLTAVPTHQGNMCREARQRGCSARIQLLSGRQTR